MTGVLTRRGRLETDTQRKCHVTMEAEIWVMHPQIKEQQGLPATPEARRGAQNEFSLGDSRLWKDTFWMFSATQFVVLSYGSCRKWMSMCYNRETESCVGLETLWLSSMKRNLLLISNDYADLSHLRALMDIFRIGNCRAESRFGTYCLLFLWVFCSKKMHSKKTKMENVDCSAHRMASSSLEVVMCLCACVHACVVMWRCEKGRGWQWKEWKGDILREREKKEIETHFIWRNLCIDNKKLWILLQSVQRLWNSFLYYLEYKFRHPSLM